MSVPHAPRILVPLDIGDDHLVSSTVPEPDAGEVEWVSGASHAAGDIRIRTETHRKYMAKEDHADATVPPEDDPARWKDVGATNRHAMFDERRTTQTVADGEITVVLRPGFFNALDCFLLTGSLITVTVRDEPGGAVIFGETRPIVGPFIDEYDYCWGPHRSRTTQLFSGIMPYPDAELTISVTATPGTPVGIGMACIGDLRPLILGDWGGALYGARAEPITASYIKTDDFGDTEIVRRASATNVELSLLLPLADADYALSCIQEVLDVPVAIIATDLPRYSGLNVFGLISGPVSYDGPNHATVKALVKGIF